MKNKSKKWKWFLLIIPALMILGIIRINLDEMKSKDGTSILFEKISDYVRKVIDSDVEM